MQQKKAISKIANPKVLTAQPEMAWYLLQCKPRDGFRADEHLQNQGFSTFHPTHPVRKTQRGKPVVLIESLFPYYVFVRLHKDVNWVTIRSTRGVARIISFNGHPTPVADAIVHGLRFQCAILNNEVPDLMFKPGETVTIIDGCFKDLKAVVSATKGDERVVLLLNMLNRPQYVEVPVQAVAAL